MNLVVLGAHHGPLATDLLRGSVVAPVVQKAPCPVAVVPETPPHGARSTS
jgi:nucleotide-binding universal stress UspA family protein